MTPDNLSIIFLTASIFCLLAAAIIALTDLHYRRRSLRRMRDMIQSAIDGTFRAEMFDESLAASVENKLAEYLAATETQMGKTAAEQEKTKTLIADISHQTKTPIANLLLYTELLKEEGGERLRYGRAVGKSGEKAGLSHSIAGQALPSGNGNPCAASVQKRTFTAFE